MKSQHQFMLLDTHTEQSIQPFQHSLEICFSGWVTKPDLAQLVSSYEEEQRHKGCLVGVQHLQPGGAGPDPVQHLTGLVHGCVSDLHVRR